MNKAYLNAIIICKEGEQVTNALKYHDIRNTKEKIDSFLRFAKRKAKAGYVNFYYKTDTPAEKGKNYAFRLYIE
jgi:hypothetical protein